MKYLIALLVSFVGAISFAALEEVNIATAGPGGISSFDKIRKEVEAECGCKVNFRVMEATNGIKFLANGKADAIILPDPEVHHKLKTIDFSPVGFETIDIQPFYQGNTFLLVSSANPIYKISDQQVTDLLKKKTTNWKEISGLDAEVKMYKARNLTGLNVAIAEQYLKNPNLDITEVVNFEGLVRAVKNEKGSISFGSALVKDDGIKSLELSAKLNLFIVTKKTGLREVAQKVKKALKDRPLLK